MNFLLPRIFAVVFMAILVTGIMFRYDTNHGGYRDRFSGAKTYYRDGRARERINTEMEEGVTWLIRVGLAYSIISLIVPDSKKKEADGKKDSGSPD